MKYFLKFFILSTVLYSSIAFADLQVFPLRVELTDKERIAQVSVRHKGNKPMKYRITAVFYKMGADGSMTLVENTSDPDRDGRRYFRFSPRQVDLEPNVEQIIRIVSRLPGDAAEGAYRAHLHFEGLSDSDDRNYETQDTKGAKLILKARMAVAIPVVIKKGETKSSVTLRNFKFIKNKDQKLAFSAEMSKEGNGFAYGNFVARPIDGSKKAVAVANGVSSYIDQRTVSFPLTTDNLTPGKYELLFLDPQSPEEKILARAETTYAP